MVKTAERIGVSKVGAPHGTSEIREQEQCLSRCVGQPTLIDFALMGRHKGRLDSVKGATMTSTAFSNSRKMYLTTAGILAFGVAAYGLGRVYPPLGPSEGTVGPA